jgi:hypothetical protein
MGTIFRDLELLRGKVITAPILEMSVLRREEKHEGRVKKGLHGSKHISSGQIIELRTYETGCVENNNNIVNQIEGCDIESYSPWVGTCAQKDSSHNRLSHCALVLRCSSSSCPNFASYVHQPFHFLLLFLRRALLDRKRRNRKYQEVKLEIYP